MEMYQQATKYCGKKEKLLLRSNFSSFPQYFQCISNLGVKLHIHSVKGGCSINCFPQFCANLICQSSDISKCFIESLGFRDNKSRLYTWLLVVNELSVYLCSVGSWCPAYNSCDTWSNFEIIWQKCTSQHITKTCLFKYTENFNTKKMKIFRWKILILFIFLFQNIDCRNSLEPPRRGGSNEYPQSMFLSRNKKNNVYPCKPQFYYIKVGFKGVSII